MKLGQLLGTTKILSSTQFSSSTNISSIHYDSREVLPNSAFFAISGTRSDGNDYIAEALTKGAVAIFSEELPEKMAERGHKISPQASYIQVANCRIALAELSAKFYGNPERELIILGVTGTDGKSTTVSFLHQLLEMSSIPTGYISTVAIQESEFAQANTFRQSTPESLDIHRILRAMLKAGKVLAVIESTSHGLSSKTARLHSISYDAAIFTNIDHEHLDFHGSFEQYRSDKGNLFRKLRKVDARKLNSIIRRYSSDLARDGFIASEQPIACINGFDPQVKYYSDLSQERNALVQTYGVMSRSISTSTRKIEVASNSVDFLAEIISESIEGTLSAITYTSHAPKQEKSRVQQTRNKVPPKNSTEVYLPLPGTFNVENLLGCLSLLNCFLGLRLPSLARLVPNLVPVSGRMIRINEGQDFDLLIDYAHTPGSFRKLLPMLKSICRKRLILVFGSAGERDRQKRHLQGKIAASYANIIILTNEDPRSENPTSILNDIEAGINEANSNPLVIKIPDRQLAIESAIKTAETGDMIALLGKGHEQSIFMADGKKIWDEERSARNAVRNL